jgi:hypothetical protein
MATVTNATDASVTWQVDGLVGGNATVGTISVAGVYTAPASVPSPAVVTVTAVSNEDPAKSASASVTFTAPPAASAPSPPQSSGGGGGGAVDPALLAALSIAALLAVRRGRAAHR